MVDDSYLEVMDISKCNGGCIGCVIAPSEKVIAEIARA